MPALQYRVHVCMCTVCQLANLQASPHATQTDSSGDALTAAQQREGAVQMAPEQLHPADRAAAQQGRAESQGQ